MNDKREEANAYYPRVCAHDKREDSGNYYPGGTVVPQGKVPTHQLDSYIKKQEGLEVKTNTITDLREAVKDLAKAMGAMVVSAFAAMAAFSVEVQTAKLGEIELDTGSVVTNVVLDDVATTADLDGKRDKTDLKVYEPKAGKVWTVAEIDADPGWTAELVDYPDDDPGWWVQIYKNGEFDSSYPVGEIPETTDRYEVWNFGSVVRVVFTRQITLQPTGDQLATTSTVAQVARSVVNTVWDAKLGVAWEARMHNGALYYIAVTNRPPEVAQ